jgi:chromosomal replication initiation ATPase DnaA
MPSAALGSASEYSFETFVIGSNNWSAHGRAVAAAGARQQGRTTPFVYGDSGLGKTQILDSA